MAKKSKDASPIIPALALLVFGVAGIVELYYILNYFIDSTNSIYVSIIFLIPDFQVINI